MNEIVERLMRNLERHKERYVRAWIAATGVHPKDAMLVQRQTLDGYSITVMRRSEADAVTRLVHAARKALVPECVSCAAGDLSDLESALEPFRDV